MIRVEIQKANSYQLGRTHGHHRQQGKTVIDGTTQRKGGTITLLDEGRKLALARGRCSRRVKRQRWIDGLLRSDRVAEALPLLLRLGEFADRLGYRDVCATALLNAAIILAQTRRSMLGHASSRCGPCRCSIQLPTMRQRRAGSSSTAMHGLERRDFRCTDSTWPE